MKFSSRAKNINVDNMVKRNEKQPEAYGNSKWCFVFVNLRSDINTLYSLYFPLISLLISPVVDQHDLLQARILR